MRVAMAFVLLSCFSPTYVCPPHEFQSALSTERVQLADQELLWEPEPSDNQPVPDDLTALHGAARRPARRVCGAARSWLAIDCSGP